MLFLWPDLLMNALTFFHKSLADASLTGISMENEIAIARITLRMEMALELGN